MAVTFTSHGYDTSVSNPYTELSWADAHPVIGAATYGVRGLNDWRVTAVAGADRTVSIAAGKGFGHGVTDETTMNDTIQLDAITAGSRWDLIAVRRDWTPTAGVSQFVKVNGGATAVLPGGRLVGPGGIDDQPIALVQVTAGQTQPTGIIDLRTWVGDGGAILAAHDLVRSFMNAIGTRIHVGGIDWLRRIGNNDTPEWVRVADLGRVALYGTNGSTTGTTPNPSTGNFLIQAGSSVGYTENSGYGRITWPTPFPNGCLTVILTNGDSWATGNRVHFAVEGRNNFWGESGGGGKNDVVYVAHDLNTNANAARPNMLHRINWIAIGW